MRLGKSLTIFFAYIYIKITKKAKYENLEGAGGKNPSPPMCSPLKDDKIYPSAQGQGRVFIILFQTYKYDKNFRTKICPKGLNQGGKHGSITVYDIWSTPPLPNFCTPIPLFQ